MPKFICEYCEYADLENQSCYHTGWDKCQGDDFIDSRIKKTSIKFANHVNGSKENVFFNLSSGGQINTEQYYTSFINGEIINANIAKVYGKNVVIKVGSTNWINKGLGDFLAYSRLPRLLKKAGYEKVYLSSFTPFRNEDVKKLIMTNPYIDGIVDVAPYNSSTPIDIDTLFGKYFNNQKNIIDIIEHEYEVSEDSQKIPEVYYKPKLINSYKGSIIYDPNCITNNCGVTVENITKYFSDNNIKIDYQFKGRERYQVILPNVPVIETKDIFDWIDILYSCKYSYSLFTGVNLLMSGLDKRHGVIYVPETDGCINFWKMPNIEYIELPKNNKKEFYIKTGRDENILNGIGDFLVYSRLPRLLKQAGYENVYITPPLFRNDGIKELIMMNPYIDGIASWVSSQESFLKQPEININFFFDKYFNNQSNLMGLIEKRLGLHEGGNDRPEIYYKPKLIEKYKKNVIFDPNCFTNSCGVTPDRVTKYFSDNNIKIDYQFRCRERITFELPDIPYAEYNTIFEWIDILWSCKHSYSSFTGINAIMSGLNKPHSVFYGPDHPDTDKCIDFFRFDNINYIKLEI